MRWFTFKVIIDLFFAYSLGSLIYRLSSVEGVAGWDLVLIGSAAFIILTGDIRENLDLYNHTYKD